MQIYPLSYHKRRALRIFVTVLLAITILFALRTEQAAKDLTPKSAVNTYLTHFLGGFDINTPARATKAAANGIQVAFNYGEPPSSTDSLGQALNSLHMKVIDTMLWAYLYRYECHRLKTIESPSFAPYCSDDHPEMADKDALFAAITAHLQQVKANQLIIGYWVLDDWIQEEGSAKQILIDIHKLVQQYTPGRPTICGFGGNIGLNQNYEWDDWTTNNFSPQGCDMVAPYIYTSLIADGTPSSDAFNWSMKGLLPTIFASLEKRGWDIEKEPFIGIGQAFGGLFTDRNRYYVIPNAQGIATQSKSFCEHGATGLVFYTWDNSGFEPTSQTPMNNSEIETGIQKGIAVCKGIWRS